MRLPPVAKLVLYWHDLKGWLAKHEMLGFFYLRVAAWKVIAHSMPALLQSRIINCFFQCIWKCHSSSGSVVWYFGMQREGNCPLIACARAFAKLKFFTCFSEMPFLLWINLWYGLLWHAAGRHLPTQCLRLCFRCCHGSHCLLNGRAFAS